MTKKTNEQGGVFVDGQWQVRNLHFFVEFMNRLHISTGDIAKVVGLVRNSVSRWFIVDDTYLSYIIAVADHYGYELDIFYSVPMRAIEGTNLVIDTPERPMEKPSKRLDFIRATMRAYGITLDALAKKMLTTRNSVYLWFKHDDITIGKIYRIAELYGWQLNIRFRLKDKPAE